MSYRHHKGLDLEASDRPLTLRRKLSQGIEDEIERLHQLSGLKRATEVLFFLLLYLTGAALMLWEGTTAWGFLAGVLLMGVALNSCGLFIHEGLHGILARGRRANRIASFLVGTPILISAAAYRITHTYHHFALGKRRDLGTYRQHANKTALVWLAYFAQLMLGCVLYVLLVPYFAWRFGSRRSRRAILLEYAVLSVIYGALFSVMPGDMLLRYWFFPLLVMNVLTNIRGLASHALGDVENVYLSSRTISSPRWVSWLLLHENYHLEHHLFPKAPSYSLRRLHELIWSRLPQAAHSTSYSLFLLDFFRAALRGDLSPMGVVEPRHPEGSTPPAIDSLGTELSR